MLTDNPVDVTNLYSKNIFELSLQTYFVIAHYAHAKPRQPGQRQDDNQYQKDKWFDSQFFWSFDRRSR